LRGRKSFLFKEGKSCASIRKKWEENEKKKGEKGIIPGKNLKGKRGKRGGGGEERNSCPRHLKEKKIRKSRRERRQMIKRERGEGGETSLTSGLGLKRRIGLTSQGKEGPFSLSRGRGP